MKILQLIQKPQLRGAEIFASQLSNHLVALGHVVVMVAIFPGDAHLPFNGKILRLNRKLSNRLWDLKGWKMLAEIIRDESPDIVQANAGDTLKFAVSSRLLFGWKSKIVFRNANKMGDFIDSRAKYILNNFFVKRIDYTISVSELCRQDFIATFQFAPERVVTIPIGIEKVSIEKDLPGDLKPTFNTGKVLINVGSLVKEKNHSGLLRIFKKILRENPTLQLIVVGDGPLRAVLEQEAISLGVAQHVHFLGYRKDVLQIISHASAMVMPSLIEGLPGVILEAFYCRVPVIASNVGGVGEVVINGVTGLLVDKLQEEEFSAAVTRILNDNQFAQTIAENGNKLVLEKFSNNKIAEDFSDAYQKITTQSSG